MTCTMYNKQGIRVIGYIKIQYSWLIFEKKTMATQWYKVSFR
jgi:hypothetical protein